MGDYSLKAGNKDAAMKYYYKAADLYEQGGFSVKAIGTYNMILKIVPGETLAPMLMKLAEAKKQRVMTDEPKNSETLRKCLQSYHEVTTVGSGKESKVLDRVT